MQTIFTQTDLRAAIVQLEFKQAEEGKLLKEQALITYESIKPLNFVKNFFREAGESEDLQENFINSTVGLSAGYLSNVVFQRLSGSPVKKILGAALMFGIKSLVKHNPETIKNWGRVIFKIVKNLLAEKDKNAYINNNPEKAGL